jgi:hypothetical protein
VNRTLRLIQHNSVVLAYNFNTVILMLIIGESSIGAFLLTIYYSFILVITLHYHFIPALTESNHKCTQPCYFPLLLKPAAQKEKMDWNSSMKSSRLHVAPVSISVELWSLLLFCFIESRHSL